MKSKIPKLDQQEIDLFRKAVGSIKQIKQDKTRLVTHKPKPTSHFEREESADQIPYDTFSAEFATPAVGSEEVLKFRASGVQHRLFSQLRKGRLPIEAELDLHGMKVAQASCKLARFLHQCHANNVRCARIIHGKGYRSKERMPILKTKLNGWLRQNSAILAFCSATCQNGGTGSLYVLLRQSKR